MLSAGIIGFGLSGHYFHAKLVTFDPGFHLCAIATSRADAVAEKYPTVKCVEASKLIHDPEVEVVIIATPHTTHAKLARAALEAGKHVVVDKPFVLDAGEGRALAALAQARGLMLAVFHNRRWDGDFHTASQLIDLKILGDLTHVALCWDRNRPNVTERWREVPDLGGGLLIDLGTHLIDQALVLFGPPQTVRARIEVQRAGSRVDDFFALHLGYGELEVELSASSMKPAPRPRFVLSGSRGTWLRSGIDVQEEQLVSGMRPGDSAYGLEPSGTLKLADGNARTHPTLRGDWPQFYRRVAAAIAGGTPPPVGAEDALVVLAVIDRARESAAQGRELPFP